MMLKMIRWASWLGVAALSLFLLYQNFKPSAQDLQITTVRFAPPLQGVNYAQQPYVLINFFASWCVPCQAEHPLLSTLSEELPVVGIAWKDKPEDTARFLKDFGEPFHLTLDDLSGRIGQQWRVEGLPASFLVDHEGIIRFSRLGILEQSHFEEIQSLIRK